MKNILVITDKGETSSIFKFISDKGYSGIKCRSFVESECACKRAKIDLIISEMEICNQSAIDYFNRSYATYARNNAALPIIFYDGSNFTRQMQDNILTSLEYS